MPLIPDGRTVLTGPDDEHSPGPVGGLSDIYRVSYPNTNAIEALNRQLRKAVKTKGSFPSEQAAIKLIYLAIQNAVPQWTRDPWLDESDARVQDPVRRPATRLTINHRLHSFPDALLTGGAFSTGRGGWVFHRRRHLDLAPTKSRLGSASVGTSAP
jgi:hypothetical protein